jgi:hypothetical protein
MSRKKIKKKTNQKMIRRYSNQNSKEQWLKLDEKIKINKMMRNENEKKIKKRVKHKKDK